MDQFHDGAHVWLRSRVRGTYLRADKDGVGVSLGGRRASLKAAWAVHLLPGDDPDDLYVLLRSAAYGRYLAATNTRAPLVLGGERVALRNYDRPAKLAAIRWQAARFGRGNGILLRHVGSYFRYLRANGRYLRWINGVSVDEVSNITDMMQWDVEPIPARLGMPDLPGPTRDLSVAILWRAVAARQIRYVRASDDDGFNPEDVEGWGEFNFRGRSVHRLRHELATRLGVLELEMDLIMCVRAGRHGRLTPLGVNLPRDGHDVTIEIVVFVEGTPASAALRHPDVNAE